MSVRTLLALVFGTLAAMLLATAPATATPAPPPPPPLTGDHLGPDRLPRCADVVAAMTPRDRLAQRLMVGVDAADPGAVAENVRATQVGGIFLGGNATALLTDQALRGVQAMARVPLAVAVDDEGGRVQRLDALDGDLPSARTMARTRTPEQVRALGEERGREQLARGVTMNLAPTVDVTGRSAAIGDRSFGDDPDTVSRYAAAFVEGQRAAGVYTVLKHFPGHGRADGDSHKGRVTTPPLDDMRADDLRPYATLLGPGGPLADGRTGVLVGHLDVPGLTTDLPSSLAPEVYALLRGEYRLRRSGAHRRPGRDEGHHRRVHAAPGRGARPGVRRGHGALVQRRPHHPGAGPPGRGGEGRPPRSGGDRRRRGEGATREARLLLTGVRGCSAGRTCAFHPAPDRVDR